MRRVGDQTQILVVPQWCNDTFNDFKDSNQSSSVPERPGSDMVDRRMLWFTVSKIIVTGKYNRKVVKVVRPADLACLPTWSLAAASVKMYIHS